MGTEPHNEPYSNRYPAKLGRFEPVRSGRQRLPAKTPATNPTLTVGRAPHTGQPRRSAASISRTPGGSWMRSTRSIHFRRAVAIALSVIVSAVRRRPPISRSFTSDRSVDGISLSFRIVRVATPVPGSNQPFAGRAGDRNAPSANIHGAEHHARSGRRALEAGSDDTFDAAIRTRACDGTGSRLYPAMPYTAYTKMFARRLCWRFAPYLNTVDASPQRPSSRIPCPFHSTSAHRCECGTLLYFNQGDYKPDTQKSAEWNRGAFLVDGPGPLRRLPYTQDVSGRRQS